MAEFVLSCYVSGRSESTGPVMEGFRCSGRVPQNSVPIFDEVATRMVLSMHNKDITSPSTGKELPQAGPRVWKNRRWRWLMFGGAW